MWWKIGAGFVVIIGIGVAMLSTYKASVSGLMNKVGLVDSDFGAAVVTDKISQLVIDTKSRLACDLPTRMRGSVQFLLASDQEQGKLAFELGQARIVCGADMLSRGDAEVGTYEIIKGMGYLRQGYDFVGERMGVDRRVCEGLPEGEMAQIMNQVLEATSGKVYEIIWNDWSELQRKREPIDRECLDQRLRTR